MDYQTDGSYPFLIFFLPTGTVGSFVWRRHQNNSPVIVCFHCLDLEKGAFDKSYDIVWQLLLYLLIFPSFTMGFLDGKWHDPEHPVPIPTHSLAVI